MIQSRPQIQKRIPKHTTLTNNSKQKTIILGSYISNFHNLYFIYFVHFVYFVYFLYLIYLFVSYVSLFPFLPEPLPCRPLLVCPSMQAASFLSTENSDAAVHHSLGLPTEVLLDDAVPDPLVVLGWPLARDV